MGPGGSWTVIGAVTHSGTATGNTVHVDVSAYHQIGIYSAVDIYFNFGSGPEVVDAGTDCNTSNDLVIPADTLIFLQIPLGMKANRDDYIFFNHLGLTAGAVRVVGV
jgi:hypothetical protein